MNKKNSKESLCWKCRNSLPDKEFGCNWSERFEPVIGWESVYNKDLDSYFVKKCPDFLPD